MQIYAFKREEYGNYSLIVKHPVTNEFVAVTVCNITALHTILYNQDNVEDKDDTHIPKLPYNTDLDTYLAMLNTKLPSLN